MQLSIFNFLEHPMTLEIDDPKIKNWMFTVLKNCFARDISKAEKLLITNLETGVMFECTIHRTEKVDVKYPNSTVVTFNSAEEFKDCFLSWFWR